MYHNISPKKKIGDVHIKDFENQIKLLKKLNYQPIVLKNLHKNYNFKKIVITFDDAYENIFKYAFPILKHYKFPATIFVVTNSVGKFNIWDIEKINFTKEKIINKDQINILIENKFEIGSHSEKHIDLTTLSYLKKKKIILEPIKYFKKNFKYKISSFSYPFGKYDNECLKIIEKNYKYAVTTKRSRYKHFFNNLLIPRIPINSDTNLFKFFLKLTTPYEDIKYKN